MVLVSQEHRMDLQLVNTELSESRLFRSTRQFSSLGGSDIANLLYLNTLVTYLMSQDKKQAEYAQSVAKNTSQYTGYSLFRTHGTDLYMLAYQVSHPNTDHTKVANPADTKAFLRSLKFEPRLHYKFMRDLSNKSVTPQQAYTYLYRLETQLKVSDSKYKRWRRLVINWNRLKYPEKQSIVTQIAQELRRIGATQSELMLGLTPMMKYKKYSPVTEPSTAKKVAGAALGAIAGRYAADKLNKAGNNTAKNIGTGIGAIAGYWAGGRNKK